MKIVCGIGAALRFAVVCAILGMVLGFALGTSWTRDRAEVQSGASAPARAILVVPAAAQTRRAVVATGLSAVAARGRVQG